MDLYVAFHDDRMKTMLVFKHQGKPKVMKILVDYSKMANIPEALQLHLTIPRNVNQHHFGDIYRFS